MVTYEARLLGWHRCQCGLADEGIRVLCYPQANQEKSKRKAYKFCEWDAKRNGSPFPYISEIYGTKNYIYEKFFTPAARLLFYLIVYIMRLWRKDIKWRGTQVGRASEKFLDKNFSETVSNFHIYMKER